MKKADVIARCIFWLIVGILAWSAVLLRTPTKETDDGILITEAPTPTTKPKDKEKQVWSILREEFPETATAAIMGNIKVDIGDFELSDTEVRTMIADYKATEPMSYKRMQTYGTADIVTATEDFRISYYHKASVSEYNQYKRARWAKTIYAGRCEDIYTIETASTAPYQFSISDQIEELNKRLKNGEML